MLRTSLGYIIARSFPEELIVLFIGCYFLNLKIPAKTILKKSLILGIIVSLIRMLPISFGIHTILGMGLVLLVLVRLSESDFINCILALCKIFLCLIISEVIYVKLLTEVFKVPENVFMYNYTIKGAIYTLPSLLVFIILSIVLQSILKRINKGKTIKNNA